MTRLLTTLFLLVLFASPASAQYALQFGKAVAVSDGQVLVGEGRNLLLPGSVFVYEKSDEGSWQLADELKSEQQGGDALGFGRVMAVSGNTLAVGAPTEGAVYFFDKSDDGNWQRSGKLIRAHVGFGATIALEGNHLLVGARGDRSTVGGVYAYHLADGEWQEAGELVAGEMETRDSYGSVLAVHNNRAVVGAPGKDKRAGKAYAFSFADGAWEQTEMISFKFGNENQGFGSSLEMAGSYLAVGIPGYEQRTGAVALYKVDEESGEWMYDRKLAPFDARGGEQFGASIAYAAGTLWVGAPGYGDQEGMVYQFHTNNETLRMSDTQQTMPAALQYRSYLGDALAVSDDLAVFGAYGHDNFEGVAFVYNKEGDGWRHSGTVYNDDEFATVNGDMVKCEDGQAGAFTCDNIDMVSFMSRSDVGAKRGMQVNDVWGWEDPQTGSEYALVGRTDGTSFIDLSDPSFPVYLGNLALTEGAHQSIWRDVKVYKDHAFIVSDGAGPHHMQVFDLRQLRNLENAPVEFEATAIYKGIYSSHNIIINEDTGFAYAVGSDSGGETCGGALHMINVQDPTNPTFAGCFADERTGRGGSGATHDAQCVVYNGPDNRYQGREICLSSNGTALSIADVTDKQNPVAISIAEYPKVAYTHQGWLTDDHSIVLLNDELDEVDTDDG